MSVRCRPIAPGDRAGVVARLARGFPARDEPYWERAVAQLERHVQAQGFPHYGYVIQAGSDIVGALLMIFSREQEDGRTAIRCNLSSWCVDDAYRSYGPLLVNAATRDKTVTYFNISPETLTRATVEAQGFEKYCEGLFLCLPLLSWRPFDRVSCRDGQTAPAGHASARDLELMRGHAGLDCLSLWCEADGEAHPFIFVQARRFRGLLAAAHVVYCPDTAMIARFAGPIGRWLAARGIFVLTVDAHAPLRGLRGWFKPNAMPKYFKGPHRPRLGDLAFTELPMFGV